jgi:hypothetical protein
MTGIPRSDLSRRWRDAGIPSVTRPAWLAEALAYGLPSWAQTPLYALAAVGFDPSRGHTGATHSVPCPDGAALGPSPRVTPLTDESDDDDTVMVIESWHIGPDGEVDYHDVRIPPPPPPPDSNDDIMEPLRRTVCP